MNRICWWFVDLVARTLEADERDAVCGDLAESGESGGQALRDLLGLVLRRQAALWKDWRPWLALAVIPHAMILTRVSRNMADGSAITLWFYTHNWDWATLGNTAFGWRVRKRFRDGSYLIRLLLGMR
jgi:hypothetical protein